MKPFIGENTRVWPPATKVLHFYALPDLEAAENASLAELAERHRRILTADFSHVVTPVRPEWLHATIQMVEEPEGLKADEERTQRLIELAGPAFGRIVPFRVNTVPGAGRSGTLLDLSPDIGLEALSQAADEVIDQVMGADRSSYVPSPPHITTGYCRTEADSGLVYSRLRRSRPSIGSWTIRNVALVHVIQDAETNAYRWDAPLAVFALGIGNQDAHH